MWQSLSFRRLTFNRVKSVAVACVVLLIAPAGRAADETPAPSRALYHTDTEHLWNRLHAALFVRGAYGQDRFEPLLWADSKHLLEARSNERASALLEEFVKNNGETLIDDPLTRKNLTDSSHHCVWIVTMAFDRASLAIENGSYSRHDNRRISGA